MANTKLTDNLPTMLQGIEANFVHNAMQLAHGHIQTAADSLGITYRAMRYLVTKYSLKPEDFEAPDADTTGGSAIGDEIPKTD